MASLSVPLAFDRLQIMQAMVDEELDCRMRGCSHFSGRTCRIFQLAQATYTLGTRNDSRQCVISRWNFGLQSHWPMRCWVTASSLHAADRLKGSERKRTLFKMERTL